MKKVLLLVLILIGINSCKKEKSNETPEASYEVYIDNNLIVKNNLELIALGEVSNKLSINIVDQTKIFEIVVFNYGSTTIGEVVPINNCTNYISVADGNHRFDNLYNTPQALVRLCHGTITRESKYKVVFEGETYIDNTNLSGATRHIKCVINANKIGH